MRDLTIGTRGSKLALQQARWVASRLRRSGSPASIRVIRTTGDRVGTVPLASVGTRAGIKGIFTKEIEDALLAGEIDLAVHSLKDLPTELDERLGLGCVPRRVDPRDALLGRTVDELASGGRVGTGSPRRAAQIRALLPAVTVAEIRGNVDTRIGKLRAGQYDAILLAAAGLRRLGLEVEAAEFLEPERMVPAAGQGALGIEVRSGDDAVLAALAPLHDEAAAAEVAAERAVLRSVGGGCDVPLGALGTTAEGTLTLVAAAQAADGGMIRVQRSGKAADAERLGAEAAAQLRRDGAAIG